MTTLAPSALDLDSPYPLSPAQVAHLPAITAT